MKLSQKHIFKVNRAIDKALLNANKNNQLEINSFKIWLENKQTKKRRYEVINGKMCVIFQSKINHELISKDL